MGVERVLVARRDDVGGQRMGLWVRVARVPAGLHVQCVLSSSLALYLCTWVSTVTPCIPLSSTRKKLDSCPATASSPPPLPLESRGSQCVFVQVPTTGPEAERYTTKEQANTIPDTRQRQQTRHKRWRGHEQIRPWTFSTRQRRWPLDDRSFKR